MQKLLNVHEGLCLCCSEYKSSESFNLRCLDDSCDPLDLNGVVTFDEWSSLWMLLKVSLCLLVQSRDHFQGNVEHLVRVSEVGKSSLCLLKSLVLLVN